jgi:hypothetical protein
MLKNNHDAPLFKLTEAELQAIAEAGANAALEKMTTRVFVYVGKSFIERIFWLMGATAIGLYFLLKSLGWIK